MALQPRPVIAQPDDPTIKLIALTKGQAAIVDADKYDWVQQWNWYADYSCCTRTFYAARGERKGQLNRTIYLHRQLLGEPEAEVDHRNGNTLDCRISNLRACTHSQNHANQGPASNNTSGYPGVDWSKAKGLWRARIWVNGRHVHLGFFDFASDAITRRELAEAAYFGEYAFSNRPSEACPCAACVRSEAARPTESDGLFKRPCEAARPSEGEAA